MGFKDKFKMGDAICSDHFYNGKLMIVKEGHSRYFDGFCYVCDDMFINNQQWCAYEMMSGYSYREHSYEWRIATDDDYYKNILNYL